MPDHVHLSMRPCTAPALIPLTLIATSQDPRPLPASRPRRSLAQLRYNQSDRGVKTLLGLASTLSRPPTHSLKHGGPSNFLFITNVNDNITESFLTRALTRIGPVRKVHIPSLGGRRQGIASVQLPTAADPKVYVSNLHDKPLCGMKVSVTADKYAREFNATWKKILKPPSNRHSTAAKALKTAHEGSAAPLSERMTISASERKRICPEVPSSALSSSAPPIASKACSPSSYRAIHIPPSPSRPPVQPQASSTEQRDPDVLSQPSAAPPSRLTDDDCLSQAILGQLPQHKHPSLQSRPKHCSVRPCTSEVGGETKPSLLRRRRCAHVRHSGKPRSQPALRLTNVDRDLDGSRLMMGFAAFYPDRAILRDGVEWIVTFEKVGDRDAAFARGPSGLISSKICLRRVDFLARSSCDERCELPIESTGASPSQRHAPWMSDRSVPPLQSTHNWSEGGEVRLTVPADAWSGASPKRATGEQWDDGSLIEIRLDCEGVEGRSNVDQEKPVRGGSLKNEIVQDRKSKHEGVGERNGTISDEVVLKRLRDMMVEQVTDHVVVRREHQLQSMVNQKVLQFAKREETDRKSKKASGCEQFVAGDRDSNDGPLSLTHYSLDEYLQSDMFWNDPELGTKSISTRVKKAELTSHESSANVDEYEDLEESDGRDVRSSLRVTQSRFAEQSAQIAGDAIQSVVSDKKHTLGLQAVPKRRKAKSRFVDACFVPANKEEQGVNAPSLERGIMVPGSADFKPAPGMKAEVSTDSESGRYFFLERTSREGKDCIGASVDSSVSLAHVKDAKQSAAGKRKRPKDEVRSSHAGGPLTSNMLVPAKRKKVERKCSREVTPESSGGRWPSEIEAKGSSVTVDEKTKMTIKVEGIEQESARTAGYLRKDWQTKKRQVPNHYHPKNGSVAYSSRENRQQSRSFRKQLSMINPKHDLFTANTLKQRKKPVQYRKSMIHGMGLFSMGPIEAGEFIIEYIGELIRGAVATTRQEKYTRRGMGDSYLFRLSNGMVVDATHRGCIARFINHSCDPNVIAKIISVDGADKIVFYSKKNIKEGEELTYDYKFDFEADDQKIPCLCGAWNCRKFLN